MTNLPVRGEQSHDPWRRYGWVMWSAWLVFLVFPLLSIVGGAFAPWQVAAGIALLLAFGACYTVGARHLETLEHSRRPRYRAGAVYLGVLVLLASAATPMLGPSTTSFLPFIVAFGMFALPLRWSFVLWVGAVLLATAVALFLEPVEGAWIIAVIVLAVGAMTAAIRVLSTRSAQYEVVSRELSLAAERERVARDVHDVLGHSLTVVIIKAELAERLIDLDPARAHAELADIQELGRQALTEIRETVGGLRAARLSTELAAAHMALTGAGIRVGVPVDVEDVDPRHRTVLAWVLREAVTNVVRHSDAATCRIDLGPNLLRVSDDGRGLDGRPAGNGLRGVRERVESAGGRLRIGPGQDGHGTMLEVTL